MDVKKEAIRGVKWTSISTIVLASSAILKVSILARFLDKADFGLMALITFILGLMMLFMDMGISTAILHKQNISKNEYSSLYWLSLALSIVLFIGISLSSPLLASFYNEPELSILIPMASFNIVLSSLGRQFKTIEEKKLHFKSISYIDITSTLISLIAAIILAIEGFGVYSLVYSSILQFAVNNVLFLIRGLKENGLLFQFNYFSVKPFLKIGVFQVGGQMVNYFNRDVDILIIGKFFGSDILGGYSLAKQLVQRPSQLINPIITKVASPVLATFQLNKNNLKVNYLKLVNIVSTINLPIYICLVIFAPIAVKIFYGDGYSHITQIVRILSVYMFIRAIGNPVGSLVIATGRTDIAFIWNLISTLFFPIAIWIGSHYSIEGVAISMVAVVLVLFIPSWWILVYKLSGATLLEYINSINPKVGTIKSILKARKLL